MHIDRHSANVVAAWALRVTDSVRAATAAAADLPSSGPDAVVAIVAEPAMTIQTLRAAVGLSHPGAVRLIDRLESRGLVTRGPAPGRAVALEATPAGRALSEKILRAREDAALGALEGLTPAQVTSMGVLVESVLTQRVSTKAELRALCRLCDRDACEPCTPWAAVDRPDA